MALRKTWARDAEVIFTPDSTEEERGEALVALTDVLDEYLPEHIASVAIYDNGREVEIHE